MRNILLFFLLSINLATYATPEPFFSFGLGINSVSYSEVSSSIEGSGTKTLASGSAAIISAKVDYTYPIKNNQSIVARGLVPLIATTDRMFSAGVGYQYFFGRNNVSDIEIQTRDGSFLQITPKFRYYVGGAADIGYLIFTSKTSKKSDMVFQLGPNGGVLYRWKDGIDIVGEAEFQIGYGSIVTTTSIKLTGGLTYKF